MPVDPVQYKSRFRFQVEYGESFDVVVTGGGSLSETGLKDADPPMRAGDF